MRNVMFLTSKLVCTWRYWRERCLVLGEENKEQLVRGCETSPQQKNDQSQDSVLMLSEMLMLYEQQGYCICQTMLPNK